MGVHELSRADARRIAVRAQLLDKKRRADGVVDLIRQVTLLQIDPTAAVAPSADLVSWSRLGSSYQPSELVEALETHQLLEYRGTIRPAEDIALIRAEMAEWPGTGPLREWQVGIADWVKANEACRLDILERLRADGPLPSRDLPDTCNVSWASSGWTNNQNVTKLLDFMVQRGEVATTGRKGRERLWDLAERVYPDVDIPPADEARPMRDEKRLSALGIARSRGPECPVEPLDVREAGEPAVVAGIRGSWRVDPAQLGQPFSGRAALLSPFDRLLHDRKRMAELFEFDYVLEMFKPAAKRRFGYFALPVLYGDRLVGKLDATADRTEGEFRVNALHEDVSFTKTMRAAVDREIKDLATWLHLPLVTVEDGD
jgi:uncharacterized protein YcaQ